MEKTKTAAYDEKANEDEEQNDHRKRSTALPEDETAGVEVVIEIEAGMVVEMDGEVEMVAMEAGMVVKGVEMVVTTSVEVEIVVTKGMTKDETIVMDEVVVVM